MKQLHVIEPAAKLAPGLASTLREVADRLDANELTDVVLIFEDADVFHLHYDSRRRLQSAGLTAIAQQAITSAYLSLPE